MRNIAFSHTTPQFLAGTKDVTRRVGWESLKPGAWLMAVEKSQGLGKGGKIRRLGPIEVVSVRRELLEAITDDDVRREGFPNETATQFIARYAAISGRPMFVTRIEFRRRTEKCQAFDDGSCIYDRCPQLREQMATGGSLPMCPLFFNIPEDE